MPLKWSISHADRLVVFEFTKKLVPHEVQSAVAALIAENALPYRKLIDARFAPNDPTAAFIGCLSDIANLAAKNANLGPVAFVCGLDSAVDIIDHFNRKAGIDMPVVVFHDIESAMRWLDEVAPPRSGGP